mgnify:CR=1 FL=1
MSARVFIWVQHLLGFGHFARARAVSEALRDAGFAVTLASGGVTPAEAIPSGIAFVQLPAARAKDELFEELVDADGRDVDQAWLERRRDVLLDASPDAAASPPAQADAGDAADETTEHGDPALVRLLKLPPSLLMRGARTGAGLAAHPGRLVDIADRSRAAVEVLVRDELLTAPHSSLNVTLGATRRFAAVRTPLDEVKAIKTELGGTVNDVVLAACAGALRTLLLERGEQRGSILVVDAKGVLRWKSVATDYKIRADNAAILKAVDGLR